MDKDVSNEISLSTVGRLKEFLKDVSDNTPILFADEDIEDAGRPFIFNAVKTENAIVIEVSF